MLNDFNSLRLHTLRSGRRGRWFNSSPPETTNPAETLGKSGFEAQNPAHERSENIPDLPGNGREQNGKPRQKPGTDSAVKIPLTQGKVALVSPEDAERIGRHKWYALRSSKHRWYALRYKRGFGPVRMHREILNAPDGVPVDHADCDGLNNTRENLRLCTASLNSVNHDNFKNRHGFRGVFHDRHTRTCRPYRARIHVDGRQVNLGSHATPEGAARAYDAAAIRYHGEFARLNFPTTVRGGGS